MLRKDKVFILLNLFSMVIVLGIITAIVITYRLRDVSPFIPGPATIELVYFWLLPIVFIPILSLLFCPLILKIYLKIFLRINKTGYSVGQFTMQKREMKAKEIFGRSAMPTLLAVAIAILILNFLVSIDVTPIVDEIGAMFSMTAMCIPLASVLCIPIWMAEDYGIMIYRKGELGEITPEIQSIGTYVAYFYKGFAGITTIAQYAFLIAKSLIRESNVLMIFLIILFPLGILGYFVPIQYLLSKRYGAQKLRILKSLHLPLIDIKLQNPNLVDFSKKERIEKTDNE